MEGFEKIINEVKTEEKDWIKLETNGFIPSEIKGSLIRIGPGKFEIGNNLLNHWFDGFSNICGFKIKDNEIYFKNQFLKSQPYKKSIKNNRNEGFMFATKPAFSYKSPFRFMKFLVSNIIPFLPQRSSKNMANCNVNIIQNKDNNFVALTEVTQYVEFDKCLNTLNEYKYNNVFGQLTTAHPQINQTHIYNLIISMNLISQYKIVKQDKKTEKRKVIKRLFRFCPSYFHSFSQTKNYVILIEQPYKILFPMGIFLFPLSFLSNFSWLNKKNKIIVFEKTTGKIVFNEKIEPFFFFHTTNSYEEDDSIYLEIPCFEDPDILKQFMIKNIKEKRVNLKNPVYKKFKLNLKNKFISTKELTPTVELQRINQRYLNKKHNFVYGVGNSSYEDKENFFSNIIKIDIENNTSKKYKKQNVYFGEPVFINKKNEFSEDDGYLLILGIDAVKNKSVLICLDAKTMEEIFHSYLPKIITMGFHGHFVKEDNSK